jgi:hypothetical protein
VPAITPDSPVASVFGRATKKRDAVTNGLGLETVGDLLATRLSPAWSATQYVPVFNPLMLSGVALAGSIAALYRWKRDAIRALLGAGAGATALLTVLTILITLALRGIAYKPLGAPAILRRNLLVYGVGGVLVPFVGIKLLDVLLVALRLA